MRRPLLAGSTLVASLFRRHKLCCSKTVYMYACVCVLGERHSHLLCVLVATPLVGHLRVAPHMQKTRAVLWHPQHNCKHIQTDRQAYIHTYVHTHIDTYIHTYIDTYIQTYIHTYVRTYITRCTLTQGGSFSTHDDDCEYIHDQYYTAVKHAIMRNSGLRTFQIKLQRNSVPTLCHKC